MTSLGQNKKNGGSLLLGRSRPDRNQTFTGQAMRETATENRKKVCGIGFGCQATLISND